MHHQDGWLSFEAGLVERSFVSALGERCQPGFLDGDSVGTRLESPVPWYVGYFSNDCLIIRERECLKNPPRQVALPEISRL